MRRWQNTLSACAILTMLVAVPSWADDKPDKSALTSLTGVTREFTFNLNVTVPKYQLRPAVMATEGGMLSEARVQLWAFGCRFADPDLPFPCDSLAAPTLPGPLIRVDKGDLVRLTFKNTHSKPHTIHLHGFHRNNVDGVLPVPPHENFLIEFVANPCGTYVYHCHINTPVHQDRGMYGQFIVDCPAADTSLLADNPDSRDEVPVDHEFLIVVDEQPRDWPGLGDDPDPRTHEYIINGKAFVGPADDPLNANLRTILGDGTVKEDAMRVQQGQKVRIRLSSFGMAVHEMELFGPLEDDVPLRVPPNEVRQGSNPVLPQILQPPLEIVTNQSLNVVYEDLLPGTYLFRSTNPVERMNYELFDDGTVDGELRMGETDAGGMQTTLVVLRETHP